MIKIILFCLILFACNQKQSAPYTRAEYDSILVTIIHAKDSAVRKNVLENSKKFDDSATFVEAGHNAHAVAVYYERIFDSVAAEKRKYY